MSRISSPTRFPFDLWYSSILIPLSSSSGKEIFSRSSHIAYDRLNPHFVPQEKLSFCGIASASILLNTLLPTQQWTQTTLHSTIISNEQFYGITLDKLKDLLHRSGLPSRLQYADDEHFQEQFREDLRNQKNFLIVNYWRQLKEKDFLYRGGHLSLIGAFNQITNHLLIMDTSHKRFPHHWLTFQHLIRMMSTYDQISMKQRGYLIINQQ